MSGELRGQDERVVDTQTQQQEVEVVVQVALVDDSLLLVSRSKREQREGSDLPQLAPKPTIRFIHPDAVGYLEVAHQPQRGGDSEADDADCHESHGHPRVHGVALAQHDLGRDFRVLACDPSVSTGLHILGPVAVHKHRLGHPGRCSAKIAAVRLRSTPHRLNRL